MRYASLRQMDIANGLDIGTALFVQGCPFHCKGCFNETTWNFAGGKEWTPEKETAFLEMSMKPFVHRISILGGEPLADQNKLDVLHLLKRIKQNFPEKAIWLYSGFYLDEMVTDPIKLEILHLLDVLVDGRFVEEKKDLSLEFCGSSNQRVIDMKKTLEAGYTIELEI